MSAQLRIEYVIHDDQTGCTFSKCKIVTGELLELYSNRPEFLHDMYKVLKIQVERDHSRHLKAGPSGKLP